MRSSTNLLKSSQTSRPCQTWLPPEFEDGAYPRVGGQPNRGLPTSHPAMSGLAGEGPISDELASLLASQTDDIIAKAHEEAAVIRTDAYEDGLRKGQEEAAHILLQAQGILHEVQAWQDDILTQGESTIMDLVVQTSKKLFSDGFDLDPELLQEAVKRALNLARPLGDLHIHLHPEDVEKIQPSWEAIQSQYNQQSLQLVSDESIRVGGCLVEGQAGSVDARVETQLDRIADALEHVPGKQEDSA